MILAANTCARAFAFLDFSHPVVAWAVMRGTLVSADLVPGPAQSFASFMFAGLVQSQNNRRLNNETVIEYVRDRYHQTQVSRLRGMYFFESGELAQRAIDEKWGGHFKTENLVELNLFPVGPITRVDANWITTAPLDKVRRLDLRDLSWIDRYWAGQPSNSPVWETIIHGKATIASAEIRRRAYETVQSYFPENSVFIEMSRLGGEVGSNAGLVMPLLQRLDERNLRLAYAMYDSEFHDAAVVQQIAQHPESARLGDVMRSQPTFKIPDLTPWFREFTLGVQGQLDVATPILSVHRSA